MSETKTNKALEIAKDVNGEVQALVNKLFEKLEATPELLKTDPAVYFVKSNQVFAALVATAAQKMLTDGLNRRRIGSKTYAGSVLAWDLFLHNNPQIAEKVAAEQKEKEAKYAAESNSIEDADESFEDEGDGESADDE